jgi:hypothetical protein
MASIPEIWRMRLMLIGLILLSLVPVLLQQGLNASGIYDIRFAGGLHPNDLLILKNIGQCSYVFPALAAGALIASIIRPTLTLSRWLLAISVALFLFYVTLFLVWAVTVIELRVPV